MNTDQLRELLRLINGGDDDPTAKASTGTSLLGRRVLVRGDRSGVFYGVLDRDDGRTVELTDVRHVWSWTGALNVADLARVGPTGGKITAPVSRIRVLDAIEIVPVDGSAAVRFAAVDGWKP